MLTFDNIMAMCELQGHKMEPAPQRQNDHALKFYTCAHRCGQNLWGDKRGIWHGYAPMTKCGASVAIVRGCYDQFIAAQKEENQP